MTSDLYRKIIAQAILDACCWYFNRDYGRKRKPYGESSRPTRLESFQAYRWLIEPCEWRDKVAGYADIDADEIEDAFRQGRDREIRALRVWARSELR